MIKKRQTWGNEENEMLIKIMNEANSAKMDCSLKWERVSIEMAKNGFHKSAKQCRERFCNEMDPEIEPGSLAGKVDFRREQTVVCVVSRKTKSLERNFKGVGRSH